MITKLWKWFWSPTSNYSWGAILLVGGFAGVIFWGGFNTFVEYTSTRHFCSTMCHEMSSNVVPEYQQSIHFTNSMGVRAICSDCHVPKEWVPKMITKFFALNELLYHFLGTIDTPEKFQAKREKLAMHVWLKMKANNSHECRNCHSWEAMDWHAQSLVAQREMKKGKAEGKSCIDCHKGVAHKLPKGYESDSPVYEEDLKKL